VRNAAREWYPKVGNLRDELLPSTGKTPKGKRPQGRKLQRDNTWSSGGGVVVSSEEELKARRG
jgi:hypothetical protein